MGEGTFAEERRMVDATGSKTMVMVLAIVLLGTFICVARMSRRDASGAESLIIDATTHADKVTAAAEQVRLHLGGGKPARREAPRTTTSTWGQPSGGKANAALQEVQTLERTDQADSRNWRSQRGDSGRLDDWRR